VLEKAESTEKANTADAILTNVRKQLQKNKIHVLRCGIEPGKIVTDRKGNTRYEPSHAEALSGMFGGNGQDCVNLKQAARVVADAYLKGEVINLAVLAPDTYELHSEGGWLTVLFDGYPLGLGKLTGMQIKNHYPKGLRHL
jgi:NOL1/NOP2/fmu family ribosome biogenesis protein